jgi:MFS family permease
MHRQLRASEATAAFTTGMFAVTMVIGRLSGNKVVRRFGAAATVRTCGVIGALGAALVAVTHATLPAVVGFMMIGVGVSVVVPLAFAAAGHAGPDPTLGMAGVATVAYGAGLVAPGLIGGVADVTSLRVAFVVVAVLAGMIAVGGGLLGRAGADLGAGPETGAEALAEVMENPHPDRPEAPELGAAAAR